MVHGHGDDMHVDSQRESMATDRHTDRYVQRTAHSEKRNIGDKDWKRKTVKSKVRRIKIKNKMAIEIKGSKKKKGK